eukprot:CAMPEP_0172448696 /NCGR_PEP_ID=MMETSP1065-20121228/7647_1 /TAXON_ID=265537 /ORGANISM="Amphiprora paludosa, Strain CCMP125" /LENGTH=454 /DNA_ID=CAMNT_0013200259 /DNA_START=62 /DNA_END=1426 /DNA_ORIENTATION=-
MGYADQPRRIRRRDEDGNAQEQQMETILMPSAGARLTYAELNQSPVQGPAEETHVPLIGRAIVNPEGLELLDMNGGPLVPNVPPDMVPPIHLINSNENEAQGGYALTRKLKNLSHHGPGWGELWFGIKYKQVRPGLYQAPQPGRGEVAIKKLRKRVLDAVLRHGNDLPLSRDLRNIDHDYIRVAMSVQGRENPYREMSRMDEIGDNIHVLKQIEFLQDDHFCYIVMPKACGRQSLDHALFRQQAELAPHEARSYFVQILRILAYLEEKGIHHRDLSPDNFIFLEHDQLVVMDLAMSVRIPVDNETGRRTLIRALGRFGTPAFMAPEIWNDIDGFDGVSCDLWSAMLILYGMLTNVPLYRRPDADQDISFRYYVVARGITQDPINELIQEILGDLFDEEEPNVPDQHILLTQSQSHLALTPHAKELFHHFFRVEPDERYTLGQVMESNYVRYQED